MKKIFIFFAFLFIFLVPNPVLAQEKINQFNTSIVASQDGTMTVEETISYDFGDEYRHGIFRDIPLISKVGDLFRVIKINFEEIKRDGKTENFEVDNGAQQVEVKIGNPDKTISGVHTYSIKYKVENGIGSNFEDHDEIYWNVTGDQWQVPIASAEAAIQTDFGVIPGQTICFTGSRGSTDKNCQVTQDLGFAKVNLTKPLESYQGMSVVSSFPVGTFPKSTLQKTEPSVDPDFITFLKIIIPIYLILNLILAPYLVFRYFKNKNKNKLGKVTVNFDIPKVSPAEAGTIDNAKLDRDDIVGTIFDLAIKKYIRIEQVKKTRTLLPDETDFKLVQLKDFDDLNLFEKELLEDLFGGEKTISLKQAKLDYMDFDSLEKVNFSRLVTSNFYTKNPKVQMASLLSIGIVATFSLNLILGPVLIWLSRKMTARTSKGDEMDWQLEGLKLFLKNMKREYKWQAENQYFVEKYIPYAMSMGFIDQYMKQIKMINPNYSPSFYRGTGNFYTFYPLFGSSFSSNITTSAPSSSSGMSGGGFSGGGGGGGGGGSW